MVNTKWKTMLSLETVKHTCVRGYVFIVFKGPEQRKNRSSVDISKDWYGPPSTTMGEVIVKVRVRGLIQRGEQCGPR